LVGEWGCTLEGVADWGSLRSADEGNRELRQAPEQVSHAVQALWAEEFSHSEEPLLGMCLPCRSSPFLYVAPSYLLIVGDRCC
jgi:hypothetical protein